LFFTGFDDQGLEIQPIEKGAQKMSIVAIISQYSRESAAVAGYTASQLGYRLVLMEDLVKATAESSGISGEDFFRALKNRAPWDRLSRKKQLQRIALLEQKLCEFMAGSQMVFCGYLGYPIFHEISHALKVLVLAHPEADPAPTAPVHPARGARSNHRKLKWFKKIYQARMEDPNLYDLTLNLAHMETSEGAEIIINTLRQSRFRPMTYSMNCMCNLDLACQVRSAWVAQLPDLEVKAHDGTVYVYSKAFNKNSPKKALEVKESVMRMQDVNYVEVCRDKVFFESL
jgi:cytidylate kinase